MSKRTFDNPDRYAFNENGSIDHATSILQCVERAIAQADMLLGYIEDHFEKPVGRVAINTQAGFFSLEAELRDVKALAEIAYEADAKRKRDADA